MTDTLDVSEGHRVYTFPTPDWIEVYAFDGGTLAVYHTLKCKSVSIDPIGMTDDEIERAVAAATTILDRAPVNRQQRRAAQYS